jgi:hypothetical protein
MKTLLTLSIVAVALITSAGQKPATPKQVLFDFRVNKQVPSPKISKATERSVLSKVFRKYLTDESKCNRNFPGNNSNEYLKAARDAGQMVPSIIDMTTGSFTAAGQTQTVYVISVSECNASHADNFGTKRVAIFAGQQLVADFDSDFNSFIVRKTDLNGDGIDELLMKSDDMSQGTITEMAALMSFQNGRFHVIEDFGTVNEDSCASGSPGSSAKASVITFGSAAPGTMPKLHMDNYGASCRTAKRWKFISSGKMPE